MNMPAIKTERFTMRPTTASPVVAMTPKAAAARGKIVKMARQTAAGWCRPLIVLALVDAVLGTGLPPPPARRCAAVRGLQGHQGLIFDPFFVVAASTRALFWHLSASLQRVALGYSLGRSRVSRSAPWSGNRSGRCAGRSAVPGASNHSAAGMARCPLAAFRDGQPSAIFRDFHHLDLADNHQTRSAIRNIPAGLSQCRGGGSAQSAGILYQDHDPGGGALYIFTGCGSASACPGSRSWRRKSDRGSASASFIWDA